MKTRRSISRWVYPFFLGVVIFNFLRLATDLLKEESFWAGSLLQHIISQIILIIACYIYDIQWRHIIKKKINTHEQYSSPLKEYAIILLSTLIPLNLLAFTGESIGIFYMGNGIIDYVVLNIVSLPLLLLYNVMLQNEMISKNYSEQCLQLELIKNKQLETELNYLKAQYHPHFLFNALNTVYFQINEENKPARKTVELLSELLRYQLYDVSKIVSIAQEIDFINTYIQFQQLRMTERLRLNIHIDTSLGKEKIHPLLFQPLLENAFKYVGGDYYINIDIRMDEKKIYFFIENALPDTQTPDKKEDNGIGTENLKRRLALLYPDKHHLEIEQNKSSFVAKLMIDTDGQAY
ncbi:MAG: histidine kinase [Tannerella sp.]|jgi:sensor histidine kinase YesM|nr:histidine kinase [Tannerella sp.]